MTSHPKRRRDPRSRTPGQPSRVDPVAVQPARRAPHRPSVRFLGATETVTGSRFLFDTGKSQVLFDCGLFQGEKSLRLRNWEPFPVDPRSVDSVVISHAHLDHVGYLPALVRGGYRGSVHATIGTTALAAIVLADAGRLQEEDASYANRVGSSRHRPALPLFTETDAQEAISQFTGHLFAERIDVSEDVAVEFHRAGHILGSSWLSIHIDGYAPIAFSGDLGRKNHPILLPPDPLTPVESLLIESTYGDRTHETNDPASMLAETIVRTAGRGGTVIIPSFAVDRTEVVLIHLRNLLRSGSIPDVPIFVDSPMALDGLRVYRRAVAEKWPEIRPEILGDDDPFDTGRLSEVRTVAESKAVNDVRYPSIIIAGSGMATGGRVLHHLKARLPDPRNTVILVGYQVVGSRGRQLEEGARELKMFGDYVDVRAEVVSVPGLSVHADRTELIDWISTPQIPPRTCYVVHGELQAATALRDSIRGEIGCRAVVPHADEIVFVTGSSATSSDVSAATPNGQ